MKLKESLFIILAVIIAIVVGVFVGYKLSENKKDDNVTNNEITNDNNNTTETVKYTYDDIQGVYRYVDDELTEDPNNRFGCYVYLYDNGTFEQGCDLNVATGIMGNYIIKNNSIVLNYLFGTRSDANIIAKTGSDIITISDKNILLFTNATNWGGSKSSITLKRDTSSDENKLLQNGKKYFSDCLIKECKLNNQFVE